MSYQDLRRIWESVRDLPHVLDEPGRAALAELLVAEATALALRGEPRPLTGAATDDTLLFIGLDADAVSCLVRIPPARLDDVLAADLATLHGRVFAGGADLEPAQWDAAVRVLAALAFEVAGPDELAAWARADGSSVSAAEVTARWSRWQGCDVVHWDALVDVPARFCAIRRAM